MAEQTQQVDYQAELKEVLASFDRAAEKGGEAVGALRDGVTGLVALVQSALQGTQFKEQADLLALEMARAGMTTETIHNAPLKVARTGGADIYKVVDRLQKAAQEAREAEEAKVTQVGKSEVAKAEARALPETTAQSKTESGRK